MKTNVRLLPLTLALLLLLSIVPLAVFAEEIEPTAAHTHSYFIDEDLGYAPIDNSNHKKIRYKIYTCSCGYSIREEIGSTNESHVAESGSKKLLYTYVGESGGTISVYQLTCRLCRDTYRITESTAGSTVNGELDEVN